MQYVQKPTRELDLEPEQTQLLGQVRVRYIHL